MSDPTTISPAYGGYSNYNTSSTGADGAEGQAPVPASGGSSSQSTSDSYSLPNFAELGYGACDGLDRGVEATKGFLASAIETTLGKASDVVRSTFDKIGILDEADDYAKELGKNMKLPKFVKGAAQTTVYKSAAKSMAALDMASRAQEFCQGYKADFEDDGEIGVDTAKSGLETIGKTALQYAGGAAVAAGVATAATAGLAAGGALVVAGGVAMVFSDDLFDAATNFSKEDFTKAVENSKQTLAAGVEYVGEKASDTYQAVKEKAGEAYSSLKSKAGRGLEATKNGAVKVYEGAKDKLTGAWSSVSGLWR